MSYEKQTWTTGDTITAEKLNYMENGIEDASGYECELSIVNETIITTDEGNGIFSGNFEYVGEINVLNELEVVFDGTEYTLPSNSTYRGYGESQYYDPSFTNYPLIISATNNDKTNWKLYTSTSGTHTIILPTVSKTEIINITPGFNAAVNHIIEEQSIVESFKVYSSNGQYSSTMNLEELLQYFSTYNHMPICYFGGVPFVYAGTYMDDTMPFYNNTCFIGFNILNNSTASIKAIIFKNSADNPITIQNIGLT